MNKRKIMMVIMLTMCVLFMSGCATTDNNEVESKKDYSNESEEFLAGYLEGEDILQKQKEATFPEIVALIKQYSDLEFDLTGLEQSKYNYKGFIKGVCTAIYDNGYNLISDETSKELTLEEVVSLYTESYERDVLPTLLTSDVTDEKLTLDQGKDLIRKYIKENIGVIDNAEYELFDETHLESRVYINGELTYIISLQLDTGEIECGKNESVESNKVDNNYDPCVDCGDPVNKGNQVQLCDSCFENYTFCSGGCGELVPVEKEWCDDMTCGAN